MNFSLQNQPKQVLSSKYRLNPTQLPAARASFPFAPGQRQ
jgi:hypothetical protein